MLSICIPVYNVNITDIVLFLSDLCNSSGVEYELLLIDDCSAEEVKLVNQKVCKKKGVRYIELTQNIGRAAIRNYLSREAIFPNLLFLDCDSVICNNKFIENYLPYINSGSVVYGGTNYQAIKPDKRFLLHWKYGRKREIKPFAERNKFPTRYFKTNNFLIPKEILLQHPFDEKLKGYGHEDTLMGIEFFKNAVRIIHIENPVLHAGLEKTDVFLKKTEEGIKNLVKIYDDFPDKEILREHVHLLKTFGTIEKYSLEPYIEFFWKFFKPFLLIMVSKFLLLKVLDVYKLCLFCHYRRLK